MASHSLNKLTALEVKKAKANPTRTTMLPDGGNLYLRIEPNGNKHWIYNYTRPITSKRNQLSLGSYPNVSLEDARRARDDCKILVKKGIDPAARRLQEKHQRKNEMDHTFEVVTQKWLKNREIEGKEDSETIRRLNHDALPYIGKLSFDQLTLEVIEDRIFQPILERHAYSVAKRLKSDLNQIFKFARKRKLITYNPIEDIDLPTPPKKNHAAITEPHELASLVKAVWRYGEIYKRSIISTQIAIKLSLLIFQRPGEIRQLKKSNYYKEERCLKLIASKTK